MGIAASEAITCRAETTTVRHPGRFSVAMQQLVGTRRNRHTVVDNCPPPTIDAVVLIQETAPRVEQRPRSASLTNLPHGEIAADG